MHKYSYEDVEVYLEKLVESKARQLVRRPEFDSSEADDIRQELRLHVHLRLEKYDPSRAKISTFLDRIVCRKIASMLQFRHAQKRNACVETISLDDIEIDFDEFMIKYGRATRSHMEQLELKVDVEWAGESLPEHLCPLYGILQHKTVTELSRESNTPRSTLYERIYELRDHMADYGMGDYLNK